MEFCLSKFYTIIIIKEIEILNYSFDNRHSSFQEAPGEIRHLPGHAAPFNGFGGTGVAHDSPLIDALQNTGQAKKRKGQVKIPVGYAAAAA